MFWCCCSVTQSCPSLCNPVDCSMPGRLPCPSLSPGVCSDSCPLNWWCHPTISSSVTSFSCPQSLPASGSFPMSWLFASGGQSIGVLAPSLAFPMNIQGRFPLGLTGLISLLSKGLSRIFSNTTAQKRRFVTLLDNTVLGFLGSVGTNSNKPAFIFCTFPICQVTSLSTAYSLVKTRVLFQNDLGGLSSCDILLF